MPDSVRIYWSLTVAESLRILFILCGDATKASSRVRGYWVAECLEAAGHRCTLHTDNTRLGMLKAARLLGKHDCVIFQKSYSRYNRLLQALAHKRGICTYLDLDDAPSRINAPRTLANVEAMMRKATGVFVGSRALEDYAKKHQPRTQMIPTSVRLASYPIIPPKADPRPIVLGWVGNGAHYQEDLIQLLREPLTKLAQRHPICFKIVGACGAKPLYENFGGIEGLQIDFIDQIDWDDPDANTHAVRDFDMGLYPLLPNHFNQYKCGFKALEYMARGLPVVSSPVAINADIVVDGETGLLADDAATWVTQLEKLIADPALRAAYGNAGRRKVEAEYDVEKAAATIATTLQEDIRRG